MLGPLPCGLRNWCFKGFSKEGASFSVAEIPFGGLADRGAELGLGCPEVQASVISHLLFLSLV